MHSVGIEILTVYGVKPGSMAFLFSDFFFTLKLVYSIHDILVIVNSILVMNIILNTSAFLY